MTVRTVQPEGWPRPRGYANGMVGSGHVLFVAGQIGWDLEGRVAEGLTAQLDLALQNFVAVVRAAGGEPTDIARMTIYVTDLEDYRSARGEIGASWRKHMGRHYPAMSLVQVAALLEPRACVEIEGNAVLKEER